MRRHFHIETRDPDEYDVSLNADRIPVGQCVDKIVARVRSESFAETGESRAKLGHLAIDLGGLVGSPSPLDRSPAGRAHAS